MAVVARMKNRMTMHNRQSPMLKQEKKSIKLIKEGGRGGEGGCETSQRQDPLTQYINMVTYKYIFIIYIYKCCKKTISPVLFHFQVIECLIKSRVKLSA